MRRFVFVGVGLLSICGFSGAASAADVPAPAYSKATAVTYDWSSCYVGGHAGGVVSEDRTTSVTGSSIGFSSIGFVGGGQIGCDYQFAPGWVGGLEARAAWSGLKNSHPGSVRFPALGIIVPSQFTLGNDFLSSTTARLGHSFAERWLVYARGGAAWTREKINDAFTNPAGLAVDPGSTMTRTGWTAGTGAEWAFASHWSATLEYNYYDFSKQGTLLTSATNSTIVSIFSVKDAIHAVTAGVNYRF